jgi:hypothetical protein
VVFSVHLHRDEGKSHASKQTAEGNGDNLAMNINVNIFILF